MDFLNLKHALQETMQRGPKRATAERQDSTQLPGLRTFLGSAVATHSRQYYLALVGVFSVTSVMFILFFKWDCLLEAAR